MFDSKIFYDKVNRLCQQKDLKITPFTISLGLSNAAATGWKQGKIPSAETLKSICVHLNVSADYLLSDVEDAKYQPLNDFEIKLLSIFSQLNDREKYRFLGRLEIYVESETQKMQMSNNK